MPRIKISVDELYPYYCVTLGDCGTEVDVSEDTLARWTKVMDDFTKVQDEMNEFPRKAGKK